MGNTQGRPVVVANEVHLDHFKLLRVVGKGAFGKVRIVERKDTGLTFALKYIRKDEVVRSQNVRNIVRERRMLEHLSHPFLCNLRYSFQDYEYLYLVVDLMSGGDLRFHISRKSFKEDAVRFWIAELGCALDYIHRQGIVHRDVKPDNVLLDFEGHVHLADFNVASEINPKKPLMSRSGTPAYLAPEVYEGKGYFSEVDWWSLGVLFYECIYNKRPFEGHSHESLAAHIRTGTPRYPITSPPVSTACTSAMKSLMTKTLADRMGANSFETFKNHPFLLPLDFEALERKELEPIFRPSMDKTNFDATYDLEELLLEESPLEARTKHQKPRQQLRPDATAAERREDELHKMIEQLFEPFDYTLISCDKSANALGEGLAHGIETNTTPESSANELPLRLRPSSRSRTASPAGTGSPPLTTRISFPAISEHSTNQDMRDPTHFVLSPATPLVHNLNSQTLSSSPPSQSNRPKLRGRNSRRSSKTIVPLAEGGQVVAGPSASSGAVGTQQYQQRHKDRDQERDKDRGTATSANGASPKEKRTGFLGILSSKKMRDKSPKRENGVLGKEGARVVISEG